ncbi:hypothetical protein TrRE_jg9599 [Triparma retinervis]|uniref:Uncharacterized protein n=1 Tax=Triparma retinervis TaxID=2557542 RepID=A0A9W7A8V6_9STRA|nr:hypothetical protein TrRE_jg9599 [Triparma retinervis]
MSAMIDSLCNEKDFIAGLNATSLNAALDKYAEVRVNDELKSTGESSDAIGSVGEDKGKEGLTGVLSLLGFDKAYDRYLFKDLDRSDGMGGGGADAVESRLGDVSIGGDAVGEAGGEDDKAEKEGGEGEGEGGKEGSSDEDDEDWLDSQIG